MKATAAVIEMKAKTARPERKYSGEDRPSFSAEHLTKFLRVAEKKWGRRELAMFLVGFSHGLRVSEITGLKLSDVDFDDKKIRIRRLKNSKPSLQDLRPNVAGFSEVTVLKAWVKERATWNGAAESDFLFVSQKAGADGQRDISREQAYRLFEAICIESGIEKQYRHPHVLRHGIATILYDSGMRLESIQQMLGHKNINSTTIYARKTQAAVDKEAADIFKTVF